MLVDEDWLADALAAVSDSQIVFPGQLEVPEPVGRMKALLEARSAGFAAQRPDVVSSRFVPARVRWHPDECAAFLRALDARQLHTDSAGYVWPLCATPKPKQQRYALCCKSGDGVTVNLEYVIQLAAVAEMAAVHAWPISQLRVELGEFDAAAVDHAGCPVVLMEAKTRTKSLRPSDDTLEKLLRDWLQYRQSPPPPRGSNSGNKYLYLLEAASEAPVAVLLVAAGARWWLRAERRGDRIDFYAEGQVSYPG